MPRTSGSIRCWPKCWLRRGFAAARAYSGTVHYIIYAALAVLHSTFAPANTSPRSPLERLVVKDGNNYHGQLAVSFYWLYNRRQAAATAPFTPAGLAAVVQAYNRNAARPGNPAAGWLGTAVARRRLALRAGVVVGLRYNRVNSFAGQAATACLDCQPRPLAGLYAELLQPNRNRALYGELSG